MRKHDVRKWLHAILDLLPVILIPVFMIYSHRHDIDSYSITVKENVYYQSNLVETFEDLKVGNIYKFTDHISTVTPYSSTRVRVDVDFFLEQFPQYRDLNPVRVALMTDNVVYYVIYDGNDNSYFDITATESYFIIDSLVDVQNINSVLLQHIVYTDYKYLKGVQDVIYDDTDIGSQFFYCLYNSVNKYFNMGNVFNLSGVYDWFNTNIFSGNAPISIYIVWQIVLYEFVMDLLFLLYGLFMWFIDMVQKLMDKPLNSVK